MTDTPPEIKRRVREQVMARPAAERFVMGAQTFDAALEMLKASLPADLPKAETGIIQTALRRGTARLGKENGVGRSEIRSQKHDLKR